MKLITHYLHTANDSDHYYSFFYENHYKKRYTFRWKLIAETNGWRLTYSNFRNPSLEEKMKNILRTFTEELEKVEHKIDGTGSIAEVNEITVKDSRISCKVWLKGIQDDMTITFSFEEGKWTLLNLHHPNPVIGYIFHKNKQWRKRFKQDLYNNAKLRLFFATN